MEGERQKTDAGGWRIENGRWRMDRRGSAPGYMARTLSGAASIFFCKWEYVFCSAT